MTIREAKITDIPGLHKVRISVRENPLPDPGLITASDYEEFLTRRGKGWLCEADDQIVGFAIIDIKEKNIWALFITAPDTRAEKFYRKAGWKQTGIRPNGEIRFEMPAETWKKIPRMK